MFLQTCYRRFYKQVTHFPVTDFCTNLFRLSYKHVTHFSTNKFHSFLQPCFSLFHDHVTGLSQQCSRLSYNHVTDFSTTMLQAVAAHLGMLCVSQSCCDGVVEPERPRSPVKEAGVRGVDPPSGLPGITSSSGEDRCGNVASSL